MFAGCGEKGGGSSGRVAIVDLNKIVKDTGHASKIEEARGVRERNLQISVRVLSQEVQAKLATEVEKVGKRPEAKVPTAPTDAEKKILTEWIGKMRGLEQMRLDAQNRIRQAVYQQRQVNQQAIVAEVTKIRDRIKPLAQRIAREKGMDIVVTTSSVLVHDDAVDITDAVFKEVNDLLKAGEFPTVKIPEPLKVTPRTTTTNPAPTPKTP